MSKRKITIVLILASVLVLLAGLFYLLNQRFHFLADVLEGPYVIFQKENFSQVTWDSQPTTDEIIQSGGQIETFAAKGETEPVTFSVRPNVDLGLVQIDITDLTSGNNKIAKENIDLRNVKIWSQCGPKDPLSADWLTSCNDPDKTMAYNIPELLVKDNEQDLQAEEIGFVQTDKKYYAPSANEDFRAELKQGQTHTFYLSIKAPKDAVAGNYTSTVTFKPQNASQQQFSLKLEVLPFELPESGKEILLHLTQTMGDRTDFAFADIGREKYEQYLDLVREAGVTSIVLYFNPRAPVAGETDNSVENLTWLIGKIKEKGFHGTLIWRGSITNQSDTIRKYLAILQNQGFDVHVYGKDEPNDTATMKQELAISKQIHGAGGQVTTSIKKQCSEDLLDPNCPVYGLSGASPVEKIDLPIYGIGNTSSDCDFYNSWDVALSYKKLAPWLWIGGSLTRPTTATTGIFCCTWHRVTSVWDGASGRFQTYVDGVLDTETSQVGVLPSNLENLIIGAADKKASNPFMGTIDNLKVYNRALPQAEFDSAGSSNLVASYNFDEGTGTTITDQISNKSCQIHGASWATGRDGGALSFNGTDNYVDCPGGTDLGISNAMTVDAWIKVSSDAGNGRRTIVSKTSRLDNRQFIKEYITGLQNGSTQKNPYKEFYYFQIWPEQTAKVGQVYWSKPAYIRTMAGFFLYKSGLDGIVPYGLDSAYSTHGNKEYDDFDAAYKDFRAVYRTEQGFLKTLQFETFREGIDDMRYMTKFDEVLAELRLKDSAKADEIKSAVDDRLKVYTYENVDEQYPWVATNAVDQANRKFVADKITETMLLLEDKAPHLIEINLAEGQVITTNPYIILVKAENPSTISRIEFYIDNTLIKTASLPDISGTFEAVWDTSKYHSVVKVIAYGEDGTTEEITRNTSVQLTQNSGTSTNEPIIGILPKTGGDNIMNKIKNFITQILK